MAEGPTETRTLFSTLLRKNTDKANVIWCRVLLKQLHLCEPLYTELRVFRTNATLDQDILLTHTGRYSFYVHNLLFKSWLTFGI